MQNIMLLQPDFVLTERVEVGELSVQIKSVNAAAETGAGQYFFGDFLGMVPGQRFFGVNIRDSLVQ
jgi:hypothetical protein